MQLRTVARVAGLLGGLCWVVRYVLDVAGAGDGTPGDLLFWAGLVLLFVALVGFGSELVSRSARWLQAIVGVAFPLLVWSVLEVLAPGTGPSLVDAAFGAVVLVLCAVQLGRGREAPAPTRHRGAHAG